LLKREDPLARKRLTEEGVRRLKPVEGKQVAVYDTMVPRLYLMLNYGPRNPKAWRCQYYVGGKVRSVKLGRYPEMNVKAAREAARKFQEDPEGALAKSKVGSFKEIAEEFVKRHVQANGLRSREDIERSLRYVLAKWGDKPFLEIKRRDVSNLLDEITDKHSAGVADGCLAVIRKLMNWYAARSDDYTSPIVPGMKRSAPKARDRILNDAEIKAIWAVGGAFGDFVKMLLLTAQRRAKLATMKWGDIGEDGTWTIRTEAREKGNPGSLQLPQLAMDIIAMQPRLAGNPYVFAGRGGAHIDGWSKRKLALDAELPDLTPWTLHDLRRTAKSLMARSGIRPDISERVLGHAIGGVEGVYDRHSYAKEKADALNRLAGLIETIVNPPTDNVVTLMSQLAQDVRGANWPASKA
jgi:integrase